MRRRVRDGSVPLELRRLPVPLPLLFWVFCCWMFYKWSHLLSPDSKSPTLQSSFICCEHNERLLLRELAFDTSSELITTITFTSEHDPLRSWFDDGGLLLSVYSWASKSGTSKCCVEELSPIPVAAAFKLGYDSGLVCWSWCKRCWEVLRDTALDAAVPTRLIDPQSLK